MSKGVWREVGGAGRHTLASTVKVMANFNRESVTLMRLAAALAKRVARAFAVMASASRLLRLRQWQ